MDFLLDYEEYDAVKSMNDVVFRCEKENEEYKNMLQSMST